MSRFPVAFPLPAFASRSSDARRGIGPSSRSAYRARPEARPDLDGVTAFRTHELRPGWVPSIPRGRRCSSRPRDVLLTGACRSPSGQSFHPAPASHLRGSLYEASTRVHAIDPSGLPLACGRPDGTGRPWAFPRASHPADQEPTTHAEVGTGHRARTWNYALNITSSILQSGSSLVSCDLASHRPKQASRVGQCHARSRVEAVVAQRIRQPATLLLLGMKRASKLSVVPGDRATQRGGVNGA